MATLSELLGGILKDVAQSRVTADLLTGEHIASYREHPLLAHMTVPRVTIKEVSLKLKFAVAKHNEPEFDEANLGDVRQMWTHQLCTQILPRTVAQTLNVTKLDRSTSDALKKATSEVKLPQFNMAGALKGNMGELAGASIEALMAVHGRLPESIRKNVEQARFHRFADAAVRESLEATIPRLRQVAVAKSAVGMDLSILVTKSDLSSVRESDVHEITLMLAMDDVEVFQPALDEDDSPLDDSPPERGRPEDTDGSLNDADSSNQ